MPDDAIPINHEGHPARQDPKGGSHAVGLANGTVLIAEQHERQSMLSGETRMPVRRIGTDPDDLGADLLEVLVLIPESAGLRGTSGCVVLGIEIHDNRYAAIIRQGNHPSFRIRKVKIGRLVAYVERLACSHPGSPPALQATTDYVNSIGSEPV